MVRIGYKQMPRTRMGNIERRLLAIALIRSYNHRICIWHYFGKELNRQLANILERQLDLISKRAIDPTQNWIRRREINLNY